MDKKVNLDIKSLKLIYERDKPFIVPLIVIIVCIILVVKVELPLLQNFNKVKEDSKKASFELSNLKKDLSVIEDLDENSLSQQLTLLNKALPINKDFIGILDAVYLASQKTGISLGEFSFQVGDLNKFDQGQDKFPSIKLSVTALNNIRSVNNFIESISKTLPLSYISMVKSGDKTTQIDIFFYYKKLANFLPKGDMRIEPLSSQKLSTIKEISEFNNSSH